MALAVVPLAAIPAVVLTDLDKVVLAVKLVLGQVAEVVAGQPDPGPTARRMLRQPRMPGRRFDLGTALWIFRA